MLKKRFYQNVIPRPKPTIYLIVADAGKKMLFLNSTI